MHTYDSLKKQLILMGLTKYDKVLAHVSMKKVGQVEGGFDTVLDVFRDYFSEGVFMLPAHTWATVNEQNRKFDPKTSEACVGALPNAMLKRKEAVRSLHPTHSVVAFGKNASTYIEGEENHNTPTPKEGVYGRLKESKGYILLIGVTQARNTFIHSIEERKNVKNRLTKEPILMEIVKDDVILKRYFYKHYNEKFPHLSENYDRIEPLLIRHGLIDFHRFGDAETRKMSAYDLSSVIEKLLDQEETLFDSNERYEGEIEWGS